MNKVSLKGKRLRQNVLPLKKAYEDPAGIDLPITHVIKVANGIVYCGTGYAFAIPEGYFMAIHPRSSMPKKGWTLANGTGIVDPDYRGEVLICLQPTSVAAARAALSLAKISITEGNLSIDIPSEDAIVQYLLKDLKVPDTLVQFIIRKREDIDIIDIGEESLSETSRSSKGFGSSDSKSESL